MISEPFILHHGDSRDVLKTLDDNSVDSVVCDPPYALVSIVKRFGGENAAPAKGDVYARASAGFMGQSWDTGETAFAVEFWAEVMRVLKPGGHVVAFSGSRSYHRLAVAIEDAGFEIRDQIMWLYGSGFPKSHDVSKGIDKAAGAEREVIGQKRYGKDDAERSPMVRQAPSGTVDITAPATDAARQGAGWGTALKPAHEPIVVARKPLAGTVAANVLQWGTGALNIDGSRVGAEGGTRKPRSTEKSETSSVGGFLNAKAGDPVDGLGRWPANVIHDGSDEVLEAFAVYSPKNENVARFFYCGKASKADRGEGNHHPTLKPRLLMAYLCRLVTPPGGVVLDPFMGSGSTGIGAALGGFRFIGIEREAEYYAIAAMRIAQARLEIERERKTAEKAQPDLFGEAAE